MMRLKIALFLTPLALGGCFLFSSGPSSEVGRTPEELRRIRDHIPPVYDAFPYGPLHQARVGQWVKYEILQGGTSSKVMLGVSDRTETGTWVEIVEEDTVSAQLVSGENLVVEAFVLIPDSDKGRAETFTQEIIQGRARPHDQGLSGDRTESKGEAKVGGVALSVVEVEIEEEDFNGRISTERSSWSSEVPVLYAGNSMGGMVTFSSQERTITLLGFGEEYSPRIKKK